MDSLFLLIWFHFLADFPFQGEFLAKAKNRYNPIKGFNPLLALFAHAYIHAGAVYIITGSSLLSLIELITHMWIDDQKCKGEIDSETDQLYHIVLKVLYFLYMIIFHTKGIIS